MTVNTEGTSLKSPIRTGEVELLEFLAQRRACDDRDRELAWSDARALARGIKVCAADGDAVVDSVRLVVDKVMRIDLSVPLKTTHVRICPEKRGILAVPDSYQH